MDLMTTYNTFSVFFFGWKIASDSPCHYSQNERKMTQMQTVISES